jgi:hypothetical protein
VSYDAPSTSLVGRKVIKEWLKTAVKRSKTNMIESTKCY